MTFNLAAIDIGSNGARLLIKKFTEQPEGQVLVSRVMYMRVPLRLGADVFALGKISKERASVMKHMLRAFSEIMKLNGVDSYRACATSAMRDASNGAKVMRKLKRQTGIGLKIIPGNEEATLLCNNLIEQTGASQGDYAYCDVGGGSTEISLLHDGVVTYSHSYDVGTLRMLAGKVPSEKLKAIRNDLSALADKTKGIRLIGSGGNINKLYKLLSNNKKERTVAVDDIEVFAKKLADMSLDERMSTYGLKADRADVIVPASIIFTTVAQALGCKEIEAPNISLADSIVDGLYRSIKAKDMEE